MNEIYRYIDYSKQAFHQKLNRLLAERECHTLLLPLIEELREEHPGVAARVLYDILKPANIGRDRFEELCFEHGLKLSRTKAFHRTTDSTGVIRFPNLIMGKELKHINQAWASDITYYRIGDTFYYLTFVIDLYSRFIVGFSTSKRLITEQTTLPALQLALEQRKPGSGTIFHSDGGGQYYCKAFIDLTRTYKMKNSMCDTAYENAYAERINGTIKNQYLKGYNPSTFEQLVKMTERAVYNYNYVRPHRNLNKQTPADFEAKRPAGGASSKNDSFCISRIKTEQQRKNHHSSMTVNKSQKTVQKTVNVF